MSDHWKIVISRPVITSAKKRDEVSIAITSSNFVLCSPFGCTARIYFILFLIYITSNHALSIVKRLAADDILLFIAIC